MTIVLIATTASAKSRLSKDIECVGQIANVWYTIGRLIQHKKVFQACSPTAKDLKSVSPAKDKTEEEKWREDRVKYCRKYGCTRFYE